MNFVFQTMKATFVFFISRASEASGDGPDFTAWPKSNKTDARHAKSSNFALHNFAPRPARPCDLELEAAAVAFETWRVCLKRKIFND